MYLHVYTHTYIHIKMCLIYNRYVLQGVLLVAQMVKNLPAIWGPHIQSPGQEDPLEKGIATHSVFLPGEFHKQRLQSTAVTESQTQLND